MRPPALLAKAIILSLALAPPTAHAQSACGFDRLMQSKSIFATCCESTKSRECGAGFPPTCTLQCAKLIVPFYNACAKTLKTMPKGQYKFAVRDMKAYVQNCEHTQELFHYSTNKCARTSQAKEKRVLDVTRACCTQKGKFVCSNSVPLKCNVRTQRFHKKPRVHGGSSSAIGGVLV